MNHCADLSGAGAARIVSPSTGAARFSRRLISTLIVATLAGPLAGTAMAQAQGEAARATTPQGPPSGMATAGKVGQTEAGTTEFSLANGMRVIV